MAEFATIARPYAEALFNASQSELAQTEQCLQVLSEIVSDKRVQNFVRSPATSRKQVEELFSNLTKNQLPTKVNNFLQVLLENGRIKIIPEIAAQFIQLKKALEGVSQAKIYSPFAINSQELSELKMALEKRFKRKLDIQVLIDESLIGGIRVVVGDEVLDASVKACLETMKMTLTS